MEEALHITLAKNLFLPDETTLSYPPAANYKKILDYSMI